MGEHGRSTLTSTLAMAILQSIAAQFRPSLEDSSPEPSVKEKDSDVEYKAPADVPVYVADSNTAAGVAGIEAMQAIWGTKGRWILISG